MAHAERHLVFFCDPPYYGGAEGYVALLAQARPSAAYRLSALLPAGDGGEVLAGKLMDRGVDVRRFQMRHWADPRLWREIKRHLREIGGEVLHMNLPSVYDARQSVPAQLAKQVGYRRVVTTEHLPMMPRARRRMLVKMLFSVPIDAIIVHTEWNRGILSDHHHMPRRKIHIIPNGSAPAPEMSTLEREALRRELGLAPGEVGIVVVARLHKRKGHRYLLEALARIDAGDWRLLIVGDGEEEAALRRQTSTLGLDERVAFLGFREDVRRIIHANDLMALPSLIETQPLVITEAMASGLPVVATAIYGIPEIITDGKTGRLVAPETCEPLAGALRELICEDALRKSMGASALKRYGEHFTLDLMARRTYAVLWGEAAS